MPIMDPSVAADDEAHEEVDDERVQIVLARRPTLSTRAISLSVCRATNTCPQP